MRYKLNNWKLLTFATWFSICVMFFFCSYKLGLRFVILKMARTFCWRYFIFRYCFWQSAIFHDSTPFSYSVTSKNPSCTISSEFENILFFVSTILNFYVLLPEYVYTVEKSERIKAAFTTSNILFKFRSMKRNCLFRSRLHSNKGTNIFMKIS